MWKKDQIKLLLPHKRYSCLDTVIVTLYYLIITVIMILGIQLLSIAAGIKIRTFFNMPLLEPYLSTDANILLCVSIFVIFGGALGIISAIQFSYIGLTTSIAIIVSLLGFTDIYAISHHRVKNYVTSVNLYNMLYNAMMNNPFENTALHVMQSRLSCCGINNYTDWVYTYGVIPGSCCDNSTICYANDPSLNTDGCFDKLGALLTYIYQQTVTIIIALNVIGILSMFGGYFYSHLLRELKKGDKIFRAAIPRIQVEYNRARGQQQTEQISNFRNTRSSVHVIDESARSNVPTSIYPNLYTSEPPPNL